jgi:DNA-directed RNA polymerase sigma subunit (sigma70/sigma32)
MKHELNHFNASEKRKAKVRRDRMREMRKKGMTLQQVADKYGISRQRVFAILGSSRVAGKIFVRGWSRRCRE